METIVNTIMPLKILLCDILLAFQFLKDHHLKQKMMDLVFLNFGLCGYCNVQIKFEFTLASDLFWLESDYLTLHN